MCVHLENKGDSNQERNRREGKKRARFDDDYSLMHALNTLTRSIEQQTKTKNQMKMTTTAMTKMRRENEKQKKKNLLVINDSSYSIVLNVDRFFFSYLVWFLLCNLFSYFGERIQF